MGALDTVIEAVWPSWAAKRMAARADLERAKLVNEKVRGFNAVSKGRRAGAWAGLNGEKPTETTADIETLRIRAREMSRNNPYWKQARRAIVSEIIGHGIRAAVTGDNKRTAASIQKDWDAWADSKVPDVTGQLDLYGLQSLVAATVVQSGECLVVRRMQGASLRLQVLGPEYLSGAKDGELPSGGEIVGGVETDSFGAPVAYHMFKRHPSRGGVETMRVDASDVAHVFHLEEAGQLRGVSWISTVFTRLSDWDEYEDAELMRQKVSACFGAIYTGVETEQEFEPHEKLEPGMVEFMPAGTDVKLISPPASQGLRDAAWITHRAIATGLGITYEALTGDFSNVNFSSARMGQLRMAKNVSDWQQKVIIDRFLERVWDWFLKAGSLSAVEEGEATVPAVKAVWTVPSRQLIEPDREAKADTMEVRSGFKPWSETVRERGRDPEATAKQIAADQKMFDDLGIVLDVDPRKVSSQGQGSVNQKQEGESANGGTNATAA